MAKEATSGPWHAQVGETATVRDNKDNQLAICTHMHTRTGGRRDSDEVAANARLMAAAPELLEALQKVNAVLDSFGDLPDGLMAPGPWKTHDAEAKIAAARAAVAKATGAA